MSDNPGWATPDQPGDPLGPTPQPPPAGYGAPPTGAQPTGAQPTGGPPAGAQPTGAWGAPPPPPPGMPWGGPPAAPRPGVVPLRPLGVGEILDAAIAYARRNPRATLGLSAMVAVVVGVLQLVVLGWAVSEVPTFDEAAQGADETASFTVNAAQLGQGLLGFLLQLVATGLLTFVMSQAVIGRSVTIAAAWARVRPLFWRLLGVTILTGLILSVVVVACVVPGILLLAVGGLTGAGVVALVVGVPVSMCLVVWLYVALSLAPAALVLERTTVRGALRRSWDLVRGSFWRVFGISLLATILAFVIQSIVSLPFGLIGSLLGAAFGADGDSAIDAGLIGVTLGQTAASVITLPFTAGVSALLYIDRRMRREGLDLALARAAGVASDQQPVDPDAPSGQQW